MDVKLLGPNVSGLNGFAIKKNETYVLKHADRLELLLGQYVHCIEFEPPPVTDEDKTGQLERKHKFEEVDAPTMNKRSCNEDVGLCMDKNENDDLKENLEDKWEEIDNGKLLIYTAKNVTPRSKVNFYIIVGFRLAADYMLYIRRAYTK